MNREFYLDRAYDWHPQSDCFVDPLNWIGELTPAELLEAEKELDPYSAQGRRISELMKEQ